MKAKDQFHRILVAENDLQLQIQGGSHVLGVRVNSK